MSQTVLVIHEGEGLRHYPADLNPGSEAVSGLSSGTFVPCGTY